MSEREIQKAAPYKKKGSREHRDRKQPQGLLLLLTDLHGKVIMKLNKTF